MHASLDLDNSESSQVLIKFLTYWLIYHILGSDQNMGRQILAITTGTSPLQAYVEEEKELVNTTEPLLNAINGLFNIVSVRNHELLDLNQSLEHKVEERTKQLAVANNNLEHLASTDVLTELPNRRHAMFMIENLWSDNNHTLSCMMIDADGFKRINDTYGHDAGDVVLKELARTLKESVRTDDLVCRLGGDEFLIICPKTEHNGAMHLAENTRKLVNSLVVSAGGGEWHGSISVGVATRNKEMTMPDHLIKAADQGVYLAKESGKNCVKTIDS
jgi:hemerythrin